MEQFFCIIEILGLPPSDLINASPIKRTFFGQSIECLFLESFLILIVILLPFRRCTGQSVENPQLKGPEKEAQL